jgi:SAM-dependent methyltransferase
VKAVQWYEQNVATVISAYESLRAEDIHGWLLGLLPERPSLVLDIGAGSGRDAAWLEAQGHTVVAVEPAAAMRAAGQQLHSAANIRWLDDRLPALQNVQRLGMAFDFILVSAVWMHLPPTERTRAFRKVITLLKPGGLLGVIEGLLS